MADGADQDGSGPVSISLPKWAASALARKAGVAIAALSLIGIGGGGATWMTAIFGASSSTAAAAQAAGAELATIRRELDARQARDQEIARLLNETSARLLVVTERQADLDKRIARLEDRADKVRR